MVDLAILADHRVKIKENEKKKKYSDLVRELKKLWNMKVTVIPIVIRVLGTVPKGLKRELEELKIGVHIETIQPTPCWNRPEY